MSRNFSLKFLNGAPPLAQQLLRMVFSLSYLLPTAKAQGIAFKSDHYRLSHYTAETGLPHNSIKSIARDDAGFYAGITANSKLNEMGQREMLNEVGNGLEQSLVQMTNFLDNLLSYVRTTLYRIRLKSLETNLL